MGVHPRGVGVAAGGHYGAATGRQGAGRGAAGTRASAPEGCKWGSRIFSPPGAVERKCALSVRLPGATLGCGLQFFPNAAGPGKNPLFPTASAEIEALDPGKDGISLSPFDADLETSAGHRSARLKQGVLIQAATRSQ